jgi:hypothetical protein
MSLPLDYTFCSGVRCKRRGFCARWTENLKADLEKTGVSIERVTLSVAEFSDHDGTCRGDKFIPVAEIPPKTPGKGRDGGQASGNT